MSQAQIPVPLPSPSMRTAVLESATDLAGFRTQARALLIAEVPPEQVTWMLAEGRTGDLFASGPDTLPSMSPDSPVPANAPRVPAFFLQWCETVILHREPHRFALLYRMLWRLVHQPSLRDDTLDPDRLRLEDMAREVRRDLHKMKAFVRFRPIADPDGGETVHVAWFEPMHHIVDAVTPFFQKRFTSMRWAIMTPERCVQWDTHTLSFTGGARRDQAPEADAGEQLWLTYYKHIFNPARLKVKMMEKEMPRRYWANLPEAVLIAPLTAEAASRTQDMIDRDATVPAKRRPRNGPAIADASPMHTQPLGDDVVIETLAALRQAAERCRACPIGEHATQAVCGEGPEQARLMIVGEQPGDQEDLQGRPFVGPAGKLFDRALAELGWDRSVMYVTNAVKHFKFEPRGKRRIHKTPTQHEAAVCADNWLEREIALVKPAAIIALGATAARAVVGHAVAVTRERGTWMTRPDGVPVLITFHPSALLRAPEESKPQAYAAWVQDIALASEYATT